MAKLVIEDLRVWFPVDQTFFKSLLKHEQVFLKAVDGISLSIEEGEILCLAGESGCGKTTTGNAVLRLVDSSGGKIVYSGVDLLSLSSKEFRKYRQKMQKVYQDPYGSLNPRQRIVDTIGEPLEVHRKLKSHQEKKAKVVKSLESAGLLPPEFFLHKYPHELSGGQRQRVVIAGALALDPEFIVADEPVSMLDVSIRAGILKLLTELRDHQRLTYLFITHDLSLAWAICDRIAIMYLGKILEIAPADGIIGNPRNPYTQALVSVIPRPVSRFRREKIILKGDPPNPMNIPEGCRFNPRCSKKEQICFVEEPELREYEENHLVACHFP